MKTIHPRRVLAIVCAVIISGLLLPGGVYAPRQLAAAEEAVTDLRWPAGAADPQKISITFKDTDMREVLNILAYKSGINIVAGEDVQGKVSVQLKDVPWEQALDVILKTYNFTFRREGNMIRVMSLQRSLEEENKVPMTTRILPLNFAEVDALKDSLSKMLTKRGTITVDKRTNVLIVTDIPEAVDMVEKAAAKLDTLTPQVMIEALMVDVKLQGDDRWGSLLDIIDTSSGNNYSHSFNPGALATSGLFSFSGVFKGLDISGTLGALVSQNKAKILASPKVLTLDNQEAKIEIKEELPYYETTNDGGVTTTTVKFKDAGVKLFVTPHITSGNYISMNVKPEQSFKSGDTSTNPPQPIVDTRKAETNLLVKDGQTIVIGGLRKVNDTISYDKIPFIGDVPVLGLMFRKKVITTVDSELVLFVTPRIVTTSDFTPREKEMINMLGQRPLLPLNNPADGRMYPDFNPNPHQMFGARKIADEEALARREKSQEAKKRRVSEAPLPPKDIARGTTESAPESQPPAPAAVSSNPHQIALEGEAERLEAALKQLQ